MKIGSFFLALLVIFSTGGFLNDQKIAQADGNRTLNYLIKGKKPKKGKIKFFLSDAIYNQMVPETRSYPCDTCSPRSLMYLSAIEYPAQEAALQTLADQIKEKSKNKTNQVRIAVTLVQKIPYDSDKTAHMGARQHVQRLPYEVLYDNYGVCAEKSQLLINLLKKLGYGTAYLEFEAENHAAVGIKCPPQYDYRDSGYCYIETNERSIISCDEDDYRDSYRKSDPEVTVINDGDTFTDVGRDYKDGVKWATLAYKKTALTKKEKKTYKALNKKYGL